MRLSSACNRGNPLGESGGGRLPRRHWLGLGASISASDGACTGVRDGAMARVEVITGRERRRRWTEDQKRAIIAESFAPGAMVSDVARRADISSGQIYRWRQELRATPVSGFTPVLIATESPATNTEDGCLELEFTGKVRIRIPASVPPELAAAVVKALSRR